MDRASHCSSARREDCSALVVGLLTAALLSADIAPRKRRMPRSAARFSAQHDDSLPPTGRMIYGPPLGPNGFPVGPQIGQRYVAQACCPASRSFRC